MRKLRIGLAVTGLCAAVGAGALIGSRPVRGAAPKVTTGRFAMEDGMDSSNGRIAVLLDTSSGASWALHLVDFGVGGAPNYRWVRIEREQ